MKRFILWVCALSIPLIMIAWFVVTFLFYVVTLVTEPASVQELEAIKRIINYVLGFLGLLSFPVTILGIIGLIYTSKKNREKRKKKHDGVEKKKIVVTDAE